jgi:A/G-specific adenine glycosylase
MEGMICHGEKKLLPTEFGSQKSCCSRTQVKTVVPYFKILLKNSPSQKRLAGASEDQVLGCMVRIGFYRRARNIFATKEIIKNNYGNNFPNQFQQIIELPGIGKSTAGAIMSLAYLDPHPILDGNVKRVISRFLKKRIRFTKRG